MHNDLDIHLGSVRAKKVTRCFAICKAHLRVCHRRMSAFARHTAGRCPCSTISECSDCCLSCAVKPHSRARMHVCSAVAYMLRIRHEC